MREYRDGARDRIIAGHERSPILLALDFDGVVCDGRPEYFETAWQAYVAAWPPPALTPGRPDAVAARFAALRPLIESGWEMPLLVHALLAGRRAKTRWRTGTVADGRAGADGRRRGHRPRRSAARSIASATSGSREIGRLAVPPSVLSGRRPTMVSLCSSGPTRVVIVTTKAERFVRALLAAQTRGSRPRR